MKNANAWLARLNTARPKIAADPTRTDDGRRLLLGQEAARDLALVTFDLDDAGERVAATRRGVEAARAAARAKLPQLDPALAAQVLATLRADERFRSELEAAARSDSPAPEALTLLVAAATAPHPAIAGLSPQTHTEVRHAVTRSLDADPDVAKRLAEYEAADSQLADGVRQVSRQLSDVPVDAIAPVLHARPTAIPEGVDQQVGLMAMCHPRPLLGDIATEGGREVVRVQLDYENNAGRRND